MSDDLISEQALRQKIDKIKVSSEIGRAHV